MPAPGRLTDPATIRRVLIIRPTALGDVARTVPVLVAIRKALPDAQIDWLVHEAFADAIRHHPALSQVVAFPRNRFAKVGRSAGVSRDVLRWLADLRRRNYDAVFDLQGLARSGLFTRFTGAPHRVGFSNAREMAWLGYNRRHRADFSAHAVDRMLALIAAEGFETREPDMRLYTAGEDEAWLDGQLAEHGVGHATYFTIAPTARWRSKCWPIERYTEITRRLLENGAAGRHVIVLASPKEADQVRPLLDALGPDAPVTFPTTSVGQMMAVLRRTRLLVCNDSAPLHIAVGFDRPIAAVFGPTNPNLVGPYRRNDTVVRPPESETRTISDYRHDKDDRTLIEKVSVDAVWAVIQQQLSARGTVS